MQGILEILKSEIQDFLKENKQEQVDSFEKFCAFCDPIFIEFTGGGDSGDISDIKGEFPFGFKTELNDLCELADWDWYNNEGGWVNVLLNLREGEVKVSGGYYVQEEHEEPSKTLEFK